MAEHTFAHGGHDRPLFGQRSPGSCRSDSARAAQSVRSATQKRVWGQRPRADRSVAREGRLAAAVAAVDALVQATELKMADVEVLVGRYRGRRGIKAARAARELVDGGAQSPKETWLRLLLINAGFPQPQTQICVRNEWGWAEAYLDRGWEDIKVAVEHDGDQHRTSRYQYVKDIRRLETVERHGWIVVRVIAEHHRDEIIRRVHEARGAKKRIRSAGAG